MKQLFLYHISPKKESEFNTYAYNTYGSAIVCAESAEEAATIHPDGLGEWYEGDFTWVKKSY
jgi:hypothetical protein